LVGGRKIKKWGSGEPSRFADVARVRKKEI